MPEIIGGSRDVQLVEVGWKVTQREAYIPGNCNGGSWFELVSFMSMSWWSRCMVDGHLVGQYFLTQFWEAKS